MPRVRIVHWKAPESGPLIEACRACGFDVEYDDERFDSVARKIREKPPEATAIDLTRLPSHGSKVSGAPDSVQAVTLRFVREARAFEAGLRGMQVGQEAGGLVDYKICAGKS